MHAETAIGDDPSPRSKVFNSEMSSRLEEKLQIPLGAAEDKRPCRWLQGVRAVLRACYGGGETQVKSKGMIAWLDKFESNLPRILGPPQQRRATGQGIMFGYDEPGKTTPRTHSMAPRLKRKLTDVRKNVNIRWLRFDGTTQVKIENVQKIDGSVESSLSTYHAEPVKAVSSKEAARYTG